jgi:acetate CoA/acetoacetate CoA-transferase alpha subunit
MSKIISSDLIMKKIHDKQVIMINSLLDSPERLLLMLLESKARELTIITNELRLTENYLNRLIIENRVSKLILSSIRNSTIVGKRQMEGILDIEKYTHKILREKLHCQSAGLSGFLLPIEKVESINKKEIIEIDGNDYVLETPLKADIAFIKAWKVDSAGNLVYRYAVKNLSYYMVMAAELVVVEAEKIVPIGSLSQNEIVTPGIYVDYIIENRNEK